MIEMDWLSPCPVGFDTLDAALQVLRYQTDMTENCKLLYAVSNCRRNFLQTSKIDKILEKVKSNSKSVQEELRSIRIALLASHSVEHLLPATRVAALARGMLANLYVAPYGQYRQVIHKEDLYLKEFSPQFILFAFDLKDMPISLPFTATQSDVLQAVTRRVEEIRALWSKAAKSFGATIIQQTFLNLDEPVFGSFERLVPASRLAIFLQLQAAIADAARQEGVLLLDMDQCANLCGGINKLHDRSRWYQARQLVSPEASVIWGDMLARVIAAASGLSRKCLIVDLDNTLWGGVVGDDGPENLRIGAGSPDGEAFYIFQDYIKQLVERGIVLAVCSKNDSHVVETAFALSTMGLSRQDVAAFVVNWNNKADNIRQIAEMLRLGLDAMVFVDDNPAERDIVRRELPQVAVPELMDDPADYPRILAASGWFEASAFTEDDATRSRNYYHDTSHTQAHENATDLEAYLCDLRMVLTAGRMTEADAPRVLQLLNKTNQFNLTTRRYTASELQALATLPDTRIWTFRLADRFSNHGLISVVILTSPENDIENKNIICIHDWIMSCRVLGRGVEDVVSTIIEDSIPREKFSYIYGEYKKTLKNGMVSELYGDLGFSQVQNATDDTTIFWIRNINDPLPERCQIACSLIEVKIND